MSAAGCVTGARQPAGCGPPCRYIASVTAAEQFGRQLRAKFKFSGAAAELEATVPPAPNEPVLLAGAVRLYWPGHLPRPLVLRLTPSRLVALKHRGFGADQVVDLPRAAVDSIRLDGDVLAVTWRSSASTSSVLSFQPWTGPKRVSSPLRDMSAVAQRLDQWLATS